MSFSRILWHSGLLLLLLMSKEFHSLEYEINSTTLGQVFIYTHTTFPLSLQCNLVQDIYSSIFSWKMNGKELLGLQNGTLVLYSPSPSKVECFQSQEFRTSYGWIFLNESQKPSSSSSSSFLSNKAQNPFPILKEPKVNNSVFDCFHPGAHLSYFWTMNGKPIDSDNESFRLLEVPGTYGCFVYYNTSFLISYQEANYFKDSVSIISDFSSQIFLFSFSNLSLECLTRHAERVSWLSSSSSTIVASTVLTLRNVRESSEWICEALQGLSVSRKSLQISVIHFKNTSEFSRVFLEIGKNSSLLCPLSLENEPLTKNVVSFHWSNQRGPLNKGHNSSSLSLKNVSEFDGGLYQCVMSTMNDSVVAVVSVEVFSVPLIKVSSPLRDFKLLSNETLSLNCSASGFPKPLIVWKQKNEFESVIVSQNSLSSSSSAAALLISKDSGLYECFASNDFGNDSTTLTVAFFELLTSPSVENLTRDAGSSVSLPCSHPHDETFEKTWRKDGISYSYFLNNNSNIFIPYLRKEHGGLYVCTLRNESQNLSLTYDLKVRTQEPQIKVSSFISPLRLLEGDSLNLFVEITAGVPAPSVSWTHQTQSFSSRVEGFEFFIQSLTKESEGNISILAVNEYGRDSHTLSLQVFTPSFLHEGPSTFIFESGSDLRLSCPSTTDPILFHEHKWLHNGSFLSSEPQLFIPSVQLKDQGLYTCSLHNSLESEKSRDIEVIIYFEAPSFSSFEKAVRGLEGSDVLISCSANGIPIPKIVWRKKEESMSELVNSTKVTHYLSGDLKIHTLKEEDEGIYICSASNTYGLITTETTVEVIKKLRISESSSTHVKELFRRVGDECSLFCDVLIDERLSSSETNLQWFKNDVPLRINNVKYELKDHKTSLTIISVDLEDEGSYKCKVQTPFESKVSTFHLTVSGQAPKILNDFKKVELYEGSDLSLMCLVVGVPRPSLSWKFAEAPITNAKISEVSTASKTLRESRIYITNVTKESNDGIYQCVAENDYGSGVAKYSTVSIIRRTEVVILSSGAPEISVAAGKQLKIPCSISSDPLNPILHVRWSKNNSPVGIGPKDAIDFGYDGSLFISNAQKRHEGKYGCHVSTRKDNASDSIDVKVLANAPVITSYSPTQRVFSGDTVEIHCEASGIPKPSIFWTFNDTLIQKRGKQGGRMENTLKISNVIISDGGSYVCYARNEYGETYKEILLSVLHLSPQELLSEITSVKENDSLNLPCLRSSLEKIKDLSIHWEKEGGEIVSKTNILFLEKVNASNIGFYNCILSLSAGRTKALGTEISIKSQLISSQRSTYFIEISPGSNLTLECNVLPGISAKRLWKHEEEIIIAGGNKDVSNKGSLLTIENISENEDSGNYKCIVMSEFGTDSLDYFVKVKSSSSSFSTSHCEVQNSLSIDSVFKIGTSNVSLFWSIPKDLNVSCILKILLISWSNETTSEYNSREIFLTDSPLYLHGLKTNISYYAQIKIFTNTSNFVGNSFSFNLNSLVEVGEGSEDEKSSQTSNLDSFSSSTILLTTLVLLFLLLFPLFLLLFFFFKRGKESRLKSQSFNSKKGQIGGGSRTSFGEGSKGDKKLHFYELLTHQGPTLDDFIQISAPVWPEPDPAENITSSQSAPLRVSFSKNSISSSWSSLFDLPENENGGEEKKRRRKKIDY